jgi:hypothetical protein
MDMDVNEMISDEAVLVDALTLKNKILMVEVAQLRAKVLSLQKEAEDNAKPKPKRGKRKA